VAASLGIRKVKLSGGEPLLRDDLVDLIANLPRLDDVSLTTNGTLLKDTAEDLKEAGLNRVNISLDSLDENKYSFITGKDMLSSVLDGIESAIDADLFPIKLNMVILRGVNEAEIDEMIDFSRERSLILQLIELLDIHPGLDKYRYDFSMIEETLSSRASRITEREMHRRRKYLIDGSEVEVVRPMDNSVFCANCSRLRITSDGKAKPCLLRNDNLVPLGETEDEICEAIKLAVKRREPFYKGQGLK
jgi:cyclic pyranopterin phosphate synthase